MIKSIQLHKLFGRFNYNISMKSGGVTIITGPNGFGKSTILRIINALNSENIEFFMDLDFSKIMIVFDNEKKAFIQKTGKNLSVNNASIPLLDKDQLRFFQRRSQAQQRNTSSPNRNDIVDYEMLYSVTLDDYRYAPSLSTKPKDFQAFCGLQKEFKQIKGWCGDVRFISDQRLIREAKRRSGPDRGREIVDVIQELPNRLKGEISKVSEEYSRIANTLDGSYPTRLFATRTGIRNQAEYEARLREANEKFKKLRKYDLVELPMIKGETYNESYSTALKIYFDDFAEKYTVFQDLISKLDLFTKIINSRLTFKHLQITRDNGFIIVDNDNPKKVLSLSQLSSGEKQEIVLFYELIFDTRKELLLLIDEPEISLHITWQKQFLGDLLEVSKLIALHAIFGWAICFNGLSMKKAFETETQNINTAKIISQIRELNPSLTEHIRRQVDQVHIEYDKKHDLPELLSITQGHDFLDYFRELCSTTWPKCGKFPSSRELSRALVTSFRQDDFKRTVLYQQLDSYQNAYHLKILPA